MTPNSAFPEGLTASRNSYPVHTRRDLLEQLKPFPSHAVFETHKSGGVTARLELLHELVPTAPGAPVPPILAPQDGYLFLDKAKFAASFAGDVDADKAAFIADSQVPWGVDALERHD